MDMETTQETITTPPKLQLFSSSLPPLRSPEHSGTLTPPLQTHASVPFQWEEHPGKPLPCTALAIIPQNDVAKCLELQLPPGKTITKTPSPTTVLEGPYSCTLGRAVLESSSFRFPRKRYGSFDGGTVSGGSSPDRGLLGAIVLRSGSGRREGKGLFGSWRKRSGGFGLKGKSDVVGGSFVFSSYSDDGTVSCDGVGEGDVKVSTRKRSILKLSHSKSHFWATIYGAFKQVIPRRSTKWKKDSL